MNTRDTLALFAGLGTGYMQQQDKERVLKQQQADIDWQNNLRQRDQTAYDLAQKQRGDLVAAAAPQTPVAVMQKPDTADNIDVGQDASAAPVATGQYDVNGTPYADQATATAAASAANTPTAQMARMAGALRANGDPVAAAQLEAQARQSQLGDIQLTEAQRQQHQQQFNDQLLTALPQGHQAIADFISNSQGDGHGGAMKATVMPSADGKTVTYKFTKPDGTTSTSPEFSNDKNGAVEAAFMLQQGMTPQMLVAHNEALTKDKREQQLADQTGAYQLGMLKNQADKVWLMGEAANARAEAAVSRAALAAQTTKDPVLQAQLGITGKMLEQTTDQIARLRASPDYDPTKPPKGEASLLASQAALQQKVLDLVGGKGHPGGVPAVFDSPAPGTLPAGAKHIPGFVAPPVVGESTVGAPAVAPMGAPTALMMTSPTLRASADAQRAKEAQSVAAGLNFQRLMQEAQAAQMTHGTN
jgi:hypothetical protein